MGIEREINMTLAKFRLLSAGMADGWVIGCYPSNRCYPANICHLVCICAIAGPMRNKYLLQIGAYVQLFYECS